MPFAEKNVYFSLKLTVTEMELFPKEVKFMKLKHSEKSPFTVYVSHVQKPTFSGVNLFIDILSSSLDVGECYQSYKEGLFKNPSKKYHYVLFWG